MKLSEIISKQVISIYDATYIGTIAQVIFDEKLTKIKGCLIYDIDDNEVFLSFNKIHSINDFLIVKNSLQLEDMFYDNKSVLGKIVVDSDGKNFGEIVDIEFDENGYITNIQCKNDSVSQFEIIKYGEIVVLRGVKPISVRYLKPKENFKINVNSEQIVTALKSANIDVPIKINAVQDKLIGKMVSEDVLGKNNEVIAKRNQIVTQKTVLVAQKHNKLNNLFFSVV